MILKIKRFDNQQEPKNFDASFEIKDEEQTLLEALTYIKRSHDESVTFSSGCRSSVCGSCAMRVNGKEVLACAYKVKEGDYIEPLRRMPVIRDLVVDASAIEETNKRAMSFSTASSSEEQDHDAMMMIQTQTDCILCAACYSACPVLDIMPDFLGPFALSRSWKTAADSRNKDIKTTVTAVQTKGIWDCTLCSECIPVCPVGIAPKQDIAMLQGKSGMMGFMNPMFGGGMDFGSNPWD